MGIPTPQKAPAPTQGPIFVTHEKIEHVRPARFTRRGVYHFSVPFYARAFAVPAGSFYEARQKVSAMARRQHIIDKGIYLARVVEY